ncbi:MAG: hypothetical protein LBM96_04615 [Methanobrevibacter sp.]|jgi:hypothetical protein|nr:hypothetical protein [Candidatus Methanoflexus mossambicus]
MATTHVFIVDIYTFDIHLKYLFAGTGSGEDKIDFNNSSETDLKGNTENKIVSMSADANRIRKNDKIIFYVQQKTSKNVSFKEGKFYGIFKAKEDYSFLDNNDGEQYLYNSELSKNLFFRTLIEPDIIYPKGVTEWEALDSIRNIVDPYRMLWSLIYRKLKAHRGNSMITIYEFERLCQLIRSKNKRESLDVLNNELSFDIDKQEIITTNNPIKKYKGRKDEINLVPRLIKKYQDKKAFEPHLQSYIVQNIGKNINHSLDENIIPENFEIEWIGNEVSCGVGMQRIDIALSLQNKDEDTKLFIPIELKAKEADITNISQINRYMDWIEEYYIPNRPSDIVPILIAKKFKLNTEKRKEKYSNITDSFIQFNQKNEKLCNQLKYIEYEIKNNNLIFEKIDY